MAIDPTARVAQGARIGEGVEIGPYCVIGPQVELGRGVRLIAHVHITGATSIGEGVVVYPFASLGTPPQSVHYRGGPTRLIIGARCELRAIQSDCSRVKSSMPRLQWCSRPLDKHDSPLTN